MAINVKKGKKLFSFTSHTNYGLEKLSMYALQISSDVFLTIVSILQIASWMSITIVS